MWLTLFLPVGFEKLWDGKKGNKIEHFTQWPQGGDGETEVAGGSGSEGGGGIWFREEAPL